MKTVTLGRRASDSDFLAGLTPFCRLIEGVTVSDIDKRAAAMKLWKIGVAVLLLRREHQA